MEVERGVESPEGLVDEVIEKGLSDIFFDAFINSFFGNAIQAKTQN